MPPGPEQQPRRVVVTGAAGNLGRKVVAALEARPDLTLTLLDRREAPSLPIISADLRRPDPAWTRTFDGADIVVHLAANPNHRATWSELVHDNVDATLNVFEAAAAGGVRRVVFASSLHAAGCTDPLSAPAVPAISPYGISKAMGEHIGRHFAELRGLSVICLRLGMVRRGPNPAPRGHPDLATQYRWLSNRDLSSAFHLAVDAAPITFAVASVTSAVDGSPWSLADARRVLGYEPLDRFTPAPEPASQRLRRRLRRALKRAWGTRQLTSGLHIRDSHQRR